jgi:hypothetical protein
MLSVHAEPDPIASRRQRVLRPWRIAWVGYALLLTTATHWPNLSLGPEIPASDKMIHLSAFGTFALLLWMTGWLNPGGYSLRRCVLVMIVALAWAAIDEISQGLPHIYRTVSGWDYLANGMGVVAMTGWIVALRPTGLVGSTNRMRLAAMWFDFEELFATPRPWITAGIVAVMSGVPLLVLWLAGVNAEYLRVTIQLAMAIAGLSCMSLWSWQWQQQMNRSQREQPCLHCGAASHGEAQRTCGLCGQAIQPNAWRIAAVPPRRMLLGIGVKPVMLGAGILACGLGLILLTPVLYEWILTNSSRSTSVPWRLSSRVLVGVPREMYNAIDLFGCSCVLALVVGLYRGALARAYDRAERCFACGHDLRGTPSPLPGAVGTCGECGTPFSRPFG